MDWTEIEKFLSRESLYRVIDAIDEEPKNIAKIANLTGIRLEHVSKYVKELVNMGYVINLTPNARKNKIFGLNESGSRILKEIKERKLLEKE